MDTEEKRRAIKSANPRTTLSIEHTQGCMLLPDRLHLLERMPKGAKVAEVGVAFGAFSQEILNRCSPERLILIDSWASGRYRRGLKEIESKFAKQISEKKVEIQRGLSVDVLSGLEAGTFDWAYIDTNHSYETTLLELIECARIVGMEGRLAGHDFCTGNVIRAVPYGVVEAATKFCKDHKWQFDYLTLESHGHFSFCLKKL